MAQFTEIDVDGRTVLVHGVYQWNSWRLPAERPELARPVDIERYRERIREVIDRFGAESFAPEIGRLCLVWNKDGSHFSFLCPRRNLETKRLEYYDPDDGKWHDDC